MCQTTMQYVVLENLLAEADGVLRVHVLEQTETTTSQALTWRDVTLGLCVRTVTGGGRVLAWYGRLGQFSFYRPHQKEGAEQAQYEAAWEEATALQTALVDRLRADGRCVQTDGLISLEAPHLLRGRTGLVAWPAE